MAKIDFSHKVVLLTGASGGIGAGIARRLSEQGARLVLSGRSWGDLQKLIHELPHPAQAVAIEADLARPGEASRLAARALQSAGRVDVLINNAGLGYFALVEEADEQRMRQLFEVNTFSPLLLARTLVPHMKQRGGGRIINIVSCVGRVPIPSVGVYGGSKSALAMMANTMRLELEPAGVDVLNIYPGTVDTGFEQKACRERQRPGLCPQGGCGRPVDEIVELVLEAAVGPAGEYWLEPQGRRMAASAILRPASVDRKLRPLRDRVIEEGRGVKPSHARLWRLWQVETSFACNLACVMCPWKGVRGQSQSDGLMDASVWAALRPHLQNVVEIDFSGGGEPLLHPDLADWIAEAKRAGCKAGFLTNGSLLDETTASRTIQAGVDWIALSADGARAETFEAVRKGADFETFCGNVRKLTGMRMGKIPRVMFNFVMMPSNVEQLQDFVRLAAELQVDQVNFKQCDVVRGGQERKLGLFASKADREIHRHQKTLAKARKLAGKLGIETTAFAFVPDELSVCDQDPRNSLFIRYDGRVAPCINLAIGGASCFLGEEVVLPTVHYGRLPEEDLSALWQTESCRFYRTRFSQRVKAHDAALARADFEPSLIKLQEAFAKARQAMPQAPEGCHTCHYLYDI
ncbi:MAG: SDR family NAD(P)-dependent oxidoreductase [Planctomycetota bacterium]|jgi:short-subunit dehydrogenase/MoaA/NifB/PqqE/SkfB family radical SAM enzyme